jgi:hypothetical protein
MLYAGLDLSRKRLDFHLLDAEGATVEVGAAPPDADGLRGLTQRLDRHGGPIRAAIESMNGARFVHDQLESLRLIDELDREIGSCERELSPTRSPPSSATSTASPRRASSPATAASTRAFTNRASPTGVARSPNRGRSTYAGRSSRPPSMPATDPAYRERYQRT